MCIRDRYTRDIKSRITWVKNKKIIVFLLKEKDADVRELWNKNKKKSLELFYSTVPLYFSKTLTMMKRGKRTKDFRHGAGEDEF